MLGTMMIAPCLLTAQAPPLIGEPAFVAQLLDLLNQARRDPAGYARSLEQYRLHFKGKRVSLPDQSSDIDTEEGVAAVDEAIAFLKLQPAVNPVARAPLLAESAMALVRDQGESGDVGHDGADGVTPGGRVVRRGGGPFVAEVIAYGAVDAVDMLRQLIVDDGVADRGHRAIIYAPELRFAGVACGPHPEFRTMCVIDLAISADGRVGTARPGILPPAGR